MRAHRRIASTLTLGFLPFSLSAARFHAGTVATAREAPAACTLLGMADASKALGQSSRPGKEFAGPTSCEWSADPAAGDTSRRVLLNTHSVRAFQAASHPAITTIKVETVSGIGDEAFYQIYPNSDSPFIWVKKGDNAFSIRILTRLKPNPPFTADELKSKITTLAKAAVTKL